MLWKSFWYLTLKQKKNQKNLFHKLHRFKPAIRWLHIIVTVQRIVIVQVVHVRGGIRRIICSCIQQRFGHFVFRNCHPHRAPPTKKRGGLVWHSSKKKHTKITCKLFVRIFFGPEWKFCPFHYAPPPAPSSAPSASPPPTSPYVSKYFENIWTQIQNTPRTLFKEFFVIIIKWNLQNF